ncbi:MAG: hypothetical protein R3F59_13330 [Myxococcota bacterium]
MTRAKPGTDTGRIASHVAAAPVLGGPSTVHPAQREHRPQGSASSSPSDRRSVCIRHASPVA